MEDAVKYAKEYDVDPQFALELLDCESKFDLDADNPRSTALGLWQFLDGTWAHTMDLMGLSRETPKTEYPVSLEAGFVLLTEEGAYHWQECLDIIAVLPPKHFTMNEEGILPEEETSPAPEEETAPVAAEDEEDVEEEEDEEAEEAI